MITFLPVERIVVLFFLIFTNLQEIALWLFLILKISKDLLSFIRICECVWKI